MDVSPQLRHDIEEYQSLQRQLQMLALQHQQLSAQLGETERALAELEKAQGAVYKAAGMVLLETSKEGAAKDLAERKEALAARIAMLSKQEEKIAQRLKEMQVRIEGASVSGAG